MPSTRSSDSSTRSSPRSFRTTDAQSAGRGHRFRAKQVLMPRLIFTRSLPLRAVSMALRCGGWTMPPLRGSVRRSRCIGRDWQDRARSRPRAGTRWRPPNRHPDRCPRRLPPASPHPRWSHRPGSSHRNAEDIRLDVVPGPQRCRATGDAHLRRGGGRRAESIDMGAYREGDAFERCADEGPAVMAYRKAEHGAAEARVIALAIAGAPGRRAGHRIRPGPRGPRGRGARSRPRPAGLTGRRTSGMPASRPPRRRC